MKKPRTVESKVAVKYAKALFDAALEKGDTFVDTFLDEYSKLIEIFSKDNGDSFKVFISPLVSLDTKLKIIETAFKGKVQDMLYDTIVLLLKRDRFKSIFDIYSLFSLNIDNHRGIIRGDINIARIPDQQRTDDIINSLSRITGKTVVANIIEDPSLVAGFVTYLGTYYIDYSLSSHLVKIENELKRS